MIPTTITDGHNSGSGTQSNSTQSGGSHHTQYNAHNQSIYYPPAIATEQEKYVTYANRLCAGLSRPDVDREDLVYAKGKRVEGTCEWVERDPEYKSLVGGDTHLLWICGGPGKGKTMISIYLTQKLERTQQVVYFFCQAGNNKRTTGLNVLRSLLWQLVNKQPELSIHLELDLDTPEKEEITLCSRETMWMMFLRVVKDSKLVSTICVLDGLDECDEDSQNWLATKFTDLLHNSGSSSLEIPLRVILISRPSIPALARWRKIMLDSDNESTISTDIRTFVSAKVRELSETLPVLPSTDSEILCKQLENTLLSKAEGTFLWVGLVMLELVQKHTWTDVQVAVEIMPRSLSALYDRMLLSIRPEHRDICSSILSYVAIAARPYSVKELTAAIGHQNFGPLNKEQVFHDYVVSCGSLIRISEATLNLVHESARDYLLGDPEPYSRALKQSARPTVLTIRNRPLHQHPLLDALDILLSSNSGPHIDRSDDDIPSVLSFSAHARPQFRTRIHRSTASTCNHDLPPNDENPNIQVLGMYRRPTHLVHLELARLCVTCILQCGKIQLEQPRHQDSPMHPFLRYSSEYWSVHVSESLEHGHELFDEFPLFFGYISEVRDAWWRSRSPLPIPKASKTTALHIACYYEIIPWARMILEQSKSRWLMNRTLTRRANRRNDDGQAPLHMAARNCNLPLVELLLDYGADINARDRRGRTALHIATGCGGWKMYQHWTVVTFGTHTSGDFDGVDIYLAGDELPSSVSGTGSTGGYVKTGNVLAGNPHKLQPTFSLTGDAASLKCTGGTSVAIAGGAELFVSAELIADVELPTRVEGVLELPTIAKRGDDQAVYFVGREYSGGKVITSPVFISFT